jgi:hypothetical protein
MNEANEYEAMAEAKGKSAEATSISMEKAAIKATKKLFSNITQVAVAKYLDNK